MKHLIFLALSLSCAVAFAAGGKLSPELSRTRTGNIDVIIQYRTQPTEAHGHAVRNMGGTLKRELGVINARHYSIPAAALAQLASDPDVAYISPDRPVQANLDQADVTIGANLAASYNVNGKGVGVAVIDSGIGPSNDLVGKVVYEQQFIQGNKQDAYGHGTHVAGIIAGGGNDSKGAAFFRTFQGVAQGVNLIDLQVLDQNGAGSDSAVIAAIEQAIVLKNIYNIRVINLSLGRPVFESYRLDPLCMAVEQAWRSGIVVVVAAGNYGRTNPTTTYGYGTITAPGNDPYAITVGAMKDMGTPALSDDMIATYSSKGPTLYDMVAKPDLVAPGNLIDSTRSLASNMVNNNPQAGIPMNLYQNGGNKGNSTSYIQLSGTSMATPFVSAAVALVLQQHPELTPNQVKARLMKTADKTHFPATSSYTDPSTGITYKAQYDVFTVGAGYLNIGNALFNTDVAPAALSAASPAMTFTSTGAVQLVSGSSMVWGSSIVWGSSVIWGSSAGSNGVVWSNSMVWGTSNLFATATGTIFGNSIVWGSGTVFGNSIVWGSANLNSQAADTGNVLVNGEGN